MRIAVHDFAGHPFQVQLSRELASRGHSVLHPYLPELPGPKGPLRPEATDPQSFRCCPVSLDAPFPKYAMWKRFCAHRRYARALASATERFQPDVMLSANTPIDVQHTLLRQCRRRGIAFVHWMQDLYCLALRNVLAQKLGPAGTPLAWRYQRLERRVCQNSDAVVFITPDFSTAVDGLGFRPARNYVIENWAPLDDVKPAPKGNPWSRRNNLADKLVFLYSGTLGLKHQPELLYRLAAALEDIPEAIVVVVSEGLGRDWLEQQVARTPRRNLVLMDFQPYQSMSEVLGAADVLLAVIEEEAGTFAVPFQGPQLLLCRTGGPARGAGFQPVGEDGVPGTGRLRGEPAGERVRGRGPPAGHRSGFARAVREQRPAVRRVGLRYRRDRRKI